MTCAMHSMHWPIYCCRAFAEAPCWFQEGDFRAYEEKQRKHRQQLADFAQRQAEVGKFQYLDVSPMTDRRYRTTSTYTAPNFVPREYTHEEVCGISCQKRLNAVIPAYSTSQIVMK